MSERYEIKAKLGEGGAGTVYRAWDTHLNRTVAIKRLLNPEGSEAGEKLRKDLLREASLLSAIQHPNICQVYDFGVDEDGGFVVMEFVNGENLEEASRRRVSVAEFFALAGQVLDGLSAAHARNILHRDLKPSNVVINWLPNALFQVKILDFGLAKFSLQPTRQTIDQASRTARGSVHFMAPEQFEHRALDQRTDLYSAGCLLFLLLTGQLPFGGKTLAEVMMNHLDHRLSVPIATLRPDVPAELAEWIGWLMSRRPEERPANTVEALDALRALSAGTSPAAAASVVSPRPATSAVPIPVPSETAPVPFEQRKTVPVFISSGTVPAALASRETQSVRVPADVPRKTVPVAVPAAKTGGIIPPATSAANRKVNTPIADEQAIARGRVPWGRLWPILASAAFAIAATIWAVVQHQSRGDRSAAAVDGGGSAVVAPPLESLVLWLDAGEQTLTATGAKPAAEGDSVDHWNDKAAVVGGNNAAIYHTITDQQNIETFLPRLRHAHSSGLSKPRFVISFDGMRNRLVVGRGRGGATGESFEKQISGSEMTCLAVARVAESPPALGRLFSARMGGEPSAWGIAFVRGEGWESGIRRRGDSSNSLSIEDKPGEFRVLTCIWHKDSDSFRFHFIRPDGSSGGRERVLRGGHSQGHVEEIRFGANSQGNADFFSGEIAEFLLYNRALDDKQLAAAEHYLIEKFFGR